MLIDAIVKEIKEMKVDPSRIIEWGKDSEGHYIIILDELYNREHIRLTRDSFVELSKYL